jgi:CBS domain-containing protein
MMEIERLIRIDDNKLEVPITYKEGMIPVVYNVNPEMTLKEVSNIMVVKHIHRVIVLSADDRRKPVGLLSAKDIVKEARKIW